MKKLFVIILLLSTATFGQKIGKLAPEAEPEVFPPNTWGVDIMFGDGGFGLGTFYRKTLSENITGFIDFSVSESKDEKEMEYVDYFGNSFTVGKENRVFIFPLSFGAQYRLFNGTITDNLRPYISAGVGPSLIITTPYNQEFFKAFSYAETKVALGGYIGFGANFGLSKNNLVGINFRYYLIHMFDDGVENLKNRFRNDLQHIYISLNIGLMY
ncbi:MAG: outer membrane beta-barrel protein [Bacteroidetes bacterium]|nr:outer membrane beta-barrel protein [Bacteroidota bacterium]